MELLPNYYKWIARRISPWLQGTVVELGVGAGHVLSHYVSRVDHVVGVDFNDALLKKLERTFSHQNVRVSKLDLRNDWQELEFLDADAVVALDVLEHFEDDQSFANKMRSVVREGGKAIVKVPAQEALFSSMDEASGHFRRYESEQLETLFKNAGFTVISLSYFNVFGGLAYRRKNKSSTNFSKSVSLRTLKTANLFMPVLSTFDWLPMKGLSLMGIFEARQCV